MHCLRPIFYRYLITSKPIFGLQQLTEQRTSSSSENENSVGLLRHNVVLPGILDEFWDFFHTLGVPTPVNKPRETSQMVSTIMIPANSLRKLFTSDSTVSRGPAHDIIEETCKLACLFYLATVKADALRLRTTGIEQLNETLIQTHAAWESSPETLLWVLLRSRGPSVESSERIQLICSLMKVAKLLQKRSWNVIKEMLICILWDTTESTEGLIDDWMSLVTELVVLGIGSQNEEPIQ